MDDPHERTVSVRSGVLPPVAKVFIYSRPGGAWWVQRYDSMGSMYGVWRMPKTWAAYQTCPMIEL